MAEPIIFDEHNLKLGEHQEQYNTLHAMITKDGTVYSVWKFSEAEMQRIAETGTIVVAQMTFNNPFQPTNVFTDIPQEAIDNKRTLDIIVIEEPRLGEKSVMLTGNSIEALHAFADKLGISKKTFQDVPKKPHYRLTSIPIIQKAIAFGALKTTKQNFEYCFREWYK